MAWRCGSLSRSLFSTARASRVHSGQSLPRRRPPPLQGHRLHPRRPLSTNPRTMGELGSTQSLLPLHTMVAAASRLTSHIAVDARAFCELSQGTFFCRTCQDR